MVYKDEEYLINEIMGQNRHQFIYGYDNEERKLLLKKIDEEYPIKIDCNLPVSIYLNEFGLPKIPFDLEGRDKIKIESLSKEHLSFSIAHAILQKTKDNLDLELVNSRIMELIEKINKYDINSNRKEITSFDELFKAVLESKEFYESYYMDYVKLRRERRTINEVVMPFLDIQSFISKYKKALNNNSYFAILLDKNKDIALSSINAVNLLVGSRINGDISMKVVVEPNKWDSYYDSNGQFIQVVHDYGVIELDDSNIEYTKKLKNKNI